MSSGPVAVIDIGSNTIKALVATRDPSGEIAALKMQAIDARISRGISQKASQLSEAGMTLGVETVRSLLAQIAEFRPTQTVLVATSAVREATNGGEFCARIQAATGHAVRILTGEEEANFIGRGLVVDPALQALRDFHVFDLGGGSLECLVFRERKIKQAVSLRLGCVRLMEKYVADPEEAFSNFAAQQIATHTREVIAHSSLTFPLPPEAIAVGTGGTVTTVRSIFAAREAKPFEETDPLVQVSELRQLLDVLAEMPLARRKQISGLPRARADVFPVALATLIAVAEAGGFSAYHQSSSNLRYGIATELLASLPG
jgi:exopolyphosphatase/guanosine-5'-triphosphate,3'-diphosphate pyrophosphatase